MIKFYSNFEQPELRTCCRNEGLYLTDILAEANRIEKEKRKTDFMRILSFIRIGRKNIKPVIVDIE